MERERYFIKGPFDECWTWSSCPDRPIVRSRRRRETQRTRSDERWIACAFFSASSVSLQGRSLHHRSCFVISSITTWRPERRLVSLLFRYFPQTKLTFCIFGDQSPPRCATFTNFSCGWSTTPQPYLPVWISPTRWNTSVRHCWVSLAISLKPRSGRKCFCLFRYPQRCAGLPAAHGLQKGTRFQAHGFVSVAGLSRSLLSGRPVIGSNATGPESRWW